MLLSAAMRFKQGNKPLNKTISSVMSIAKSLITISIKQTTFLRAKENALVKLKFLLFYENLCFFHGFTVKDDSSHKRLVPTGKTLRYN